MSAVSAHFGLEQRASETKTTQRHCPPLPAAPTRSGSFSRGRLASWSFQESIYASSQKHQRPGAWCATGRWRQAGVLLESLKVLNKQLQSLRRHLAHQGHPPIAEHPLAQGLRGPHGELHFVGGTWLAVEGLNDHRDSGRPSEKVHCSVGSGAPLGPNVGAATMPRR